MQILRVLRLVVNVNTLYGPRTSEVRLTLANRAKFRTFLTAKIIRLTYGLRKSDLRQTFDQFTSRTTVAKNVNLSQVTSGPCVSLTYGCRTIMFRFKLKLLVKYKKIVRFLRFTYGVRQVNNCFHFFFNKSRFRNSDNPCGEL